MPSLGCPSRCVSPTRLFYTPPRSTTHSRQNHIPDDLVPGDPYLYPSNSLYPCKDSKMRDIALGVREVFLREFLDQPEFKSAFYSASFEIGQRVRVRKLYHDRQHRLQWTTWARGIVISCGIQSSVMGTSYAWYEVRIVEIHGTRTATTTFFCPILGEIWDGWNDTSRPGITPDTSFEIRRQLYENLVPERVFNWATSSWQWEWTPAYNQNHSPAEPTLMVMFHGLSKAAEKHGHNHVDERFEGFVARLQTEKNDERWAGAGNRMVPVHAIWAVPFTKEVVAVLKGHGCVVAPEADF